MNREIIINELNNYSLGDLSVDNKQKVIKLMNKLVYKNKYKEYLDLFFLAITITELYGYLSYLDLNEKELFFNSDLYRASSYKAKKIEYLNSGQLSLLNEIRNEKKVFISAPTSFGKTSIMHEYILDQIKHLNKIIFVVPTNSLLEELYTKYLKYFGKDPNIYITTNPKIKKAKKNILILTPEKFLIFDELYDVNDCDLITMDETYKIMGFRPHKISDFINNRSYKFRKVADIIGSANCKTVFLSPFTYELTDSLKNFLVKNGVKKINREIEYVTHDLIKVTTKNEFRENFPNSSENFLSKFTHIDKTIAILNNLKDEKNIVFIKGYSSAYKIVQKIDSKPNKQSRRFDDFIKHLKNNYTVDSEMTWKVIEGLEKGVGIYISPIPRYIKKEIINLFENDILHTLIVTTSFTEGVNSNAKNLIFTSMTGGRYTLSPIDILNVSGRAGRFGKNSIGKIYCVNKEHFNKLEKAINDEIIKLENYNYYLSDENNPREDLIDYEYEMMDNIYLNFEAIENKRLLNDQRIKLGLKEKDLNISLNVSNRWKLVLYKGFLDNQDKIEKYYNAITNLTEDNEKIKSMTTIFEAIKYIFDKSETEINPFPTEIYDINPFDNTGRFTWGRMYKNFHIGSISEVIRSNKSYIRKKYVEIIGNNKNTSKEIIEQIFKGQKSFWIISKYFESDFITEKQDAYYNEAFKFISDIIQYKIPYYLGFFSSIFKLFITKNDTGFDPSSIDVNNIIMEFEDGETDADYASLSDFGLPRDLIKKLKDKEIKITQLADENSLDTEFDDYEKTIINDFITSFQ